MALPLNLAVLRNISISASNTPTPTSPFAICSQLKSAILEATEASILIAAAIMTIPVAVVILPLLNFAVAINASNSASNTPTPTSPSANSPQLKSAIFLTALERTRTAAANTIRFVEPFPLKPPSLLKAAMEAIRSAKRTVIAPREADSFSLSIRDMATIEPARIAIAAAILSRVPTFNCC